LVKLGAKLTHIFGEGFMRIGLIVAAVVLAVSGVAPASAAGCNLDAAKAWVPLKGQAYRTEVYSNGATCAGAVVTIVVRAANGHVLWAEALTAEHLMTFADAKTVSKMKAALADTLAQPQTFKTTGDLPAWKKGADSPEPLGEFPFYPDQGVDQETYVKIRAEKQAVFCYVQGMESMACVAVAKDGTATKLGAQSFPG
jgi:hypothetical protein